MSLASDLKPLAYSLRAIAGQLGFRPYRVFITQGFWSGDFTGRGAEAQSEVEITEGDGQPPKVEALSGEERTVNELPAGAYRIGPITPSFSGGGTLFTAIRPAIERGETVHVRLVGPNTPDGEKYVVSDIEDHKALRYMLTVVPVSGVEP